jgi:predicted lysophospholipase L1 biosynthesis ABC-type transport system permease subunit
VIAVATDGAPAALETARTKLELGLPSSFAGLFAPLTIHEENGLGQDSQRAAGYQRLADIVIIASLPIAGCTLAVSVVNSINERRRAFSLLRLTGAPLATLRRVVMLEASVPLVLGAVASIGIGFLTAYLFLNSQLNVGLQPPGLGYYACVVGGVLISLAIIGSTLPILARSTGPEAARND